MRIKGFVLAAMFTVLAVTSWATYEAVAKPRITFADRWAPVDEALHSGGFRQQ
jgi:hypothetical protein